MLKKIYSSIICFGIFILSTNFAYATSWEDIIAPQWVTPRWVDTENPTGAKVYIDMNNQYYFGWGQVYTVKYVGRDGKTNYVQIELKGLRGNRAAIISVNNEYKKTYDVPQKNNYMPMTKDKAIYNSSRKALENTDKHTCPKNICVYVNKPEY